MKEGEKELRKHGKAKYLWLIHFIICRDGPRTSGHLYMDAVLPLIYKVLQDCLIY